MMAKIPVFVYGTLRPGDYNHSRWGLSDDDVVRGVTAPGALYHVSHGRVFPCAKFDEDGTITGDILFFEEDSDELDGIDCMEIGAGYEVREVVVTLTNGEEMKCRAYHYRRKPFGSRIESGDWFAEDAFPGPDDEDGWGEDEDDELF